MHAFISLKLLQIIYANKFQFRNDRNMFEISAVKLKSLLQSLFYCPKNRNLHNKNSEHKMSAQNVDSSISISNKRNEENS